MAHGVGVPGTQSSAEQEPGTTPGSRAGSCATSAHCRQRALGHGPDCQEPRAAAAGCPYAQLMSITTHIVVRGAERAVAFYHDAFGAEEVSRILVCQS
jgi:hypothetical protein